MLKFHFILGLSQSSALVFSQTTKYDAFVTWKSRMKDSASVTDGHRHGYSCCCRWSDDKRRRRVDIRYAKSSLKSYYFFIIFPTCIYCTVQAISKYKTDNKSAATPQRFILLTTFDISPAKYTAVRWRWRAAAATGPCGMFSQCAAAIDDTLMCSSPRPDAAYNSAAHYTPFLFPSLLPSAQQ